MPTAPLRHRLDSLPGRQPAYARNGNNTLSSPISTTSSIDELPTPRSNHATSSLPQQLQSAVPSCAQPCLSTYITEEYTCASNDLSCLCSQYSSQGYTLGELAFTCLRLDCTQTSQDESVDLYNICSAQISAVSATHSTLTLPVTKVATPTAASGVTTTTLKVYATSSTSSSEMPPAQTSQASIMSSASVSTAATSTAGTVGYSAVCSGTCSPSSTATAAASSKASPTTLTNGQAVGVSVAAFGVVILIACMAYLIVCIRRRKFEQHINYRSSYDFIDDAPPQLSKLHHSWSFPQDPDGEADAAKSGPAEKKRTSGWYREQFPRAPEHSPEIGRCASLGSQKSADSMRTLSQLLPDRPGATPPRPPPKHYSLPPPTPATIFEEFSKSPRVPSAEYQSLPEPPRPCKSLPGKNVKKSEHVIPHTRVPEAARHPSLSLDIPRQASRSAQIPAPLTFPLPPIPAEFAHNTSDQRISTSSRARSMASTTGGSLLNYYASPDAGSTAEFAPLPGPIDHGIQKKKSVPAAIMIAKPLHPQRAVRHSGGSDTSFESTDPDEPTPPEELEKQLSPVHEHSPIAAVRYPKIPRSSNQSIPRSPPARLSPGMMYGAISDQRKVVPIHIRQRSSVDYQHAITPDRPKTNDSALSGSTLAAKRRGDVSTQERRLFIDTSHSRINSHRTNKAQTMSRSVDSSSEGEEPYRRSERHESPLKGYGRVASGGRSYAPYQKPMTPSFDILTPEMKSPVLQFARSSIAPQTVVLKSPLWEPKLTPRRYGEDLFLEVGVASPMYPPTPAPLPIVR